MTHGNDLAEMMAARSKMIDNMIQLNANKTSDSNFIYDDPVFRDQIEKSVEKLEHFLTFNSNFEDAFRRLHKKVKSMEELEGLQSRFEEVHEVVSL